MNTISHKDLRKQYLDNDVACQNTDVYFKGKTQPSIYQTGFYSSPSWNWGYLIGVVGVSTDLGIKYFEVVTQFGEVKAALEINIPVVRV